jgi:transcriptional regulator with XRE-family HTH domain
MAKKRGPQKGSHLLGMHRHPFGKALATARIKRGYTQEELALKLGTSKRVISHFEREVKNPPANTLKKLSIALRIPVETLLFTGQGPANDNETDVTDRGLNRRFILAQKLQPAVRKDVKRYLDNVLKANAITVKEILD